MTSAECIHGFEPGLCDICYPKTPVVAARAARVSAHRAARASAARPPRESGGRPTTPTSTSASASRPPANLLDTRVFHVTHLRNLAGILGAGGILAGESPEVDLSSPLARELRATATVEASGAAVSAFVPWYLTPDAEVWRQLRRGAAEARWSAVARAVASTDLVVLVSTVGALAASAGSGDALVVTDGDAAATFTRFGAGPGGALRMLARLHNTEQAAAAEVLVPDAVPLDAVQLIGVANEPQRDRVRALLREAGVTTRVAVYPPWFAAV